jgi:hypothetical protein
MTDANRHQLPAPTFSGVASARAPRQSFRHLRIGRRFGLADDGKRSTNRHKRRACYQELLSRESRDHFVTVLVTTISSSMRAALHPSVEGQNVSSANTIPA